MIKLTIGNSLCNIAGTTDEQGKHLRQILSYKIDARASYFSGGWRNPKRYLIDKKGNFPTGLLYLVEDYLYKHMIPNQRVDKRVRPTLNKMERRTLFLPGSHPTPYPEQIGAAEAAVVHSRGIITAPTGLGKGLIAALICDELKVPTLIVVPRVDLKKQLTEELTGYFGEALVGHLRSDGKRTKLISVENVDALNKKHKPDVDLVIIDEFHHSGAKTYRDLNLKSWNDVYFKIGLTATPFRSDENERLLLESVLSKVIYRIPYDTCVKNNRIVPLEAYYYELPVQEMKGNEASWASVYSELVVNNKIRNEVIAEIMQSLKKAGTPVVCLVKELAHGKELSKMTGTIFANGDEGNAAALRKEFNSGKIKSLIGTVGVLGEGMDTKPAEWVIMAAGGKSKNQFMQNCGRAFRKFPGKETAKIILFKDPSHHWLLTHYKQCVKFLVDEYGIAVMRLNDLLEAKNE